MQLRFSSLKGFASVWKNNFIGHKGFLLPFLPKKKEIKLGQELEIEINVEGESWGKLWCIAVWKNFFGLVDETTPRGIFLRVIKTEPTFDRKVSSIQ